MNNSSFDGGRASLLTAKRCKSGAPERSNTHGFIRITFALLITVLSILWIFNHMVTNQRMEDLSTFKVKTQNAMSGSQQLTESEDKTGHLTSPMQTKASQQRSITFKISAVDPIQKEGTEQEISANETIESKPNESVDPAISTYSEDERLNQSADNNHARSMSDLVRSIENLEAAEASLMEQAIRDLWTVAADLDAPDEAVDALEYFIMEHYDADLIALAESAIEDLQRVLEMKETAQINTYTSEDYDNEGQGEDPGQSSLADSPDGPEISENGEVSEILQAQMEDLSEQALLDPEASKRVDAIQTLSNFRNDSAVDIFLDAANDPEPMVRFLALQSLWISAADNPLGKDDFIWRSLQQAQGDIDMQVADIATIALKDLEQLEQNLAEAEVAISYEQEQYADDSSPASQSEEIDGIFDPGE